jgi:preprotein translocase subunit SecF
LLAPIENRPMVDKTSTKNGHHYVTLGVDLDGARVIHVTEGKGKATKQRIQQHLENKGVDRKQIDLANQQRFVTVIYCRSRRVFPGCTNYLRPSMS